MKYTVTEEDEEDGSRLSRLLEGDVGTLGRFVVKRKQQQGMLHKLIMLLKVYLDVIIKRSLLVEGRLGYNGQSASETS